MSFAEQRYEFVKGLVPKPMLRFLQTYYDIQLRNDRMKRDDQCPLSFAVYGDPAFDAMLEFARARLSKVSGLDLVPTYSYSRMYVKGDILARHTDRPSCEYSATVSIAIPKSAKTSTIYVKDLRGRERALDMDEGDACLYAGCEIEHWRDPIDVTGYMQMFLHYIDKNGPHYPALRFDGRPRLGALKSA